MRAILSHISAFNYWRSVHPEGLTCPEPVRIQLRYARPLCAEDIESLADRLACVGRPIHVLSPSSSERHNSDAIVAHTYSHQLPYNSFMRIDDAICLAAPELCLVQMAELTPLVPLIQFMFELCGEYTLDPSAPAGFRQRPALTNTHRLDTFLKATGGIRGHKLAERALRFARPGSASPMETALTLLLCLPPRLGGYGIEYPLLNHRVDLDAEGRYVAQRNHCVCDLFWPQHNLAVEYDSDLFHTGAARIAYDSKRRNALGYQDITVVTVTKAQIKNPNETERIARVIAKHLGKRIQRDSFSLSPERLSLRKTLLSWQPQNAD